MSVMKDSRKRLTTNHVSDELQLKEHIDERIQSWSNEIVKIDLKIPINSKLKVGLYAFNRNDCISFLSYLTYQLLCDS